jgi:hypothetical protein
MFKNKFVLLGVLSIAGYVIYKKFYKKEEEIIVIAPATEVKDEAIKFPQLKGRDIPSEMQ